MSRRTCTLVVLLLIGLLAGCSSDPAPTIKARKGAAYVALGDSYVSGPLIDDQDTTSPACLRSDHNYPSLVAKALGQASFVDVSCGGETTEMMRIGRTEADGTTIAPQLDSVTSSARLVTVGIGGNDANASAGLFNYCLIPASAEDETCDKFVSTYMEKTYPTIRKNVLSTLARIKVLAPRAKVVLTGYLRIAPETGSCDVLPLSATRREATLTWEDRINSTLTDVAKEADVPFVDVRGISRGHDACAGADAWVNGVENVPGDGAFLHPNAAGMKAVADVVLKAVEAA